MANSVATVAVLCAACLVNVQPLTEAVQAGDAPFLAVNPAVPPTTRRPDRATCDVTKYTTCFEPLVSYINYTGPVAFLHNYLTPLSNDFVHNKSRELCLSLQPNSPVLATILVGLDTCMGEAAECTVPELREQLLQFTSTSYVTNFWHKYCGPDCFGLLSRVHTLQAGCRKTSAAGDVAATCSPALVAEVRCLVTSLWGCPWLVADVAAIAGGCNLTLADVMTEETTATGNSTAAGPTTAGIGDWQKPGMDDEGKSGERRAVTAAGAPLHPASATTAVGITAGLAWLGRHLLLL